MSLPENPLSGDVQKVDQAYKDLMNEPLFLVSGKAIRVEDVAKCIEDVKGLGGHALRAFSRLGKFIAKGEWLSSENVENLMKKLSEKPQDIERLLAVMGKIDEFHKSLPKLDESKIELSDLNRLKKRVNTIKDLIPILKEGESAGAISEVYPKFQRIEGELQNFKLEQLEEIDDKDKASYLKEWGKSLIELFEERIELISHKKDPSVGDKQRSDTFSGQQQKINNCLDKLNNNTEWGDLVEVLKEAGATLITFGGFYPTEKRLKHIENNIKRQSEGITRKKEEFNEGLAKERLNVQEGREIFPIENKLINLRIKQIKKAGDQLDTEISEKYKLLTEWAGRSH